MADVNNLSQVGIATKETYDNGLIAYKWDNGYINVNGENIVITRPAQSIHDPPIKSELIYGLITDKHGAANAEELVDYWHTHFFFGKAPNDYYVEVARGNIEGQEMWNGLGERESIGITVTGEDVTRMNELTPAPTSHVTVPTPADAGELMSIVSESDEDGAAGLTGVLTVRIHYLLPTGAEAVYDVTMNGLTPVDIPVILMRFIQDSYSLTVGSNGVAVGHIKIYKTGTAGLVYDMIAAGGNKSLVPHRMVPLGKTLILQGWHGSEGNNKRAAFRLRSTDMNGILIPGVFCFKDNTYLNKVTTGEAKLNNDIPEFSIIKVSVWATAINGEGACCWWGILIDNN